MYEFQKISRIMAVLLFSAIPSYGKTIVAEVVINDVVQISIGRLSVSYQIANQSNQNLCYFSPGTPGFILSPRNNSNLRLVKRGGSRFSRQEITIELIKLKPQSITEFSSELDLSDFKWLLDTKSGTYKQAYKSNYEMKIYTRLFYCSQLAPHATEIFINNGQQAFLKYLRRDYRYLDEISTTPWSSLYEVEAFEPSPASFLELFKR